jgi:hypothetical protein
MKLLYLQLITVSTESPQGHKPILRTGLMPSRQPTKTELSGIRGSSLSDNVLPGLKTKLNKPYRFFAYILWCLLFWFLWDGCVYEHVCLCTQMCVPCTFSWGLFLLFLFFYSSLVLFVLFYFILLFYNYSLDACFPVRGGDVDPEGREVGAGSGRSGGGNYTQNVIY